MRMIDGDRLLRELTALSHGQVWPGWTYEGIRLLIERQPTLTPPNETPPCYQPDGDGCAYQCYDGDEEPIDKCKECPLCYSDKQRHLTPPNEPLTLDELREMDRFSHPIWDECLHEWCAVRPDVCAGEQGISYLGGGSRPLESGRFYRRPPEGEEHCYG